MNTLSNLHLSRIEDHNRFPNTDVLYNPLRKVLLRPSQLVASRPYLNPAASHSKITREFAYLNETDANILRQTTLIPVDQPLVPTQNFDKVRNNRFMVVDAQQRVVGAPISPEQMQRIRLQGLKQERVVYDFGLQQQQVLVQQPVQQQVVHVVQPPPPPVAVKPNPPAPQPPLIQTKIIKQQYKTTYRPPMIEELDGKSSSKKNNKYKYNLFSMIDQEANGQGCGCPNNEIIASRNEPQSINWLK